MDKKEIEADYAIELTTQQMHAISLACEMLARLGIGQARIVLDNCLPLKEHHAIDWEEYHSDLDRIEKMLHKYLCAGGIRRQRDVSKRAWDVYQTIRHRMSWDYAVSKGVVESLESRRDWNKMMGVNYDEPMNTMGEPLLKIVSKKSVVGGSED